MDTAVECRCAVEADLVELAGMRWDFRCEESPGETKHSQEEFTSVCVDFLRRGLHSGQWTYWIAEAEGRIASHVFVCRINKVPKPNQLQDADGYVTNVYTRPAFRNRGIGSELMRHVIDWAKAEGLGTLFVWPSERSVPFYERAGFIQDEQIMQIELRPYVL